MESNEKKKIYIFPSYVGAIIYYIKLLPILEDEYEVIFGVTGSNSLRLYCENHNINHIVIDIRLSKKNIVGRLPIISPILNRLKLIKSVDSFLEKNRPDIIVMSPPRKYNLQTVAQLANRQGIPTIGLQWSMKAYENNQNKKFEVLVKDVRKLPQLILSLLVIAHEFLLNKILLVVDLFRTKKLLLPRWNVDTLAVFDQNAKDTFMEMYSISESKIAVVGTYESEIVRNTVKIFEDNNKRDEICKKYDFDPSKKIVLVISMTFHHDSLSTYIMNEKGQILYFLDIFGILRKQFPADSHEIVFKMHPREVDIYKLAKDKYRVKCVGIDGVNEELIALSDLCVTHPLTSVNFPIVASNRPAICINFSELSFLDECGKYYGFKRVIKDKQEFENLLTLHKKNSLQEQYDNSTIISGVKEKVVSLLHSVSVSDGEKYN